MRLEASDDWLHEAQGDAERTLNAAREAGREQVMTPELRRLIAAVARWVDSDAGSTEEDLQGRALETAWDAYKMTVNRVANEQDFGPWPPVEGAMDDEWRMSVDEQIRRLRAQEEA